MRSSDKTKRQRVLERRLSLRRDRKIKREADRAAWLNFCKENPAEKLKVGITIRKRTILQLVEGSGNPHAMLKNGLCRLKRGIGSSPRLLLKAGLLTMEDLELSELGKKLLEMASKDDQVKAAVNARMYGGYRG